MFDKSNFNNPLINKSLNYRNDITSKMVGIFLGSIISMILCFMIIMPVFAENTKRPVLLVLGDSLSAGYRLPAEKSWPILLDELIATKIKEDPKQTHLPTIFNASISGDTAEQGLLRLPNLLETHRPDYVLIELGANNGLQGLDTQTLKMTLTTLISQIKTAGATPILMQIEIPRNYGKRYVETFSHIYPALAQEMNIELIPFFMEPVVKINAEKSNAKAEAWLQEDGIHPTEVAQPFIANWMFDTLKALPYFKD